MGKQARARRAEEKRLARWFGVREDELGQLRRTTTKAQARRALVERERTKMAAIGEIVDTMVRKATEDICRIEDERFFMEIEEALRDGQGLQRVEP